MSIFGGLGGLLGGGFGQLLGGGLLGGLGGLLGGEDDRIPINRQMDFFRLARGVPLNPGLLEGINSLALNGGVSPLSGREDQRAAALGAIDDLESFYNSQLIPMARQFLGDRMSQFNPATNPILAQSRNNQSGVLDALDRAIGQANSLAQESVLSVDRAKNDLGRLSQQRVAEGSAALKQSLNQRGLAGSSLLESGIASSILPNVMGQEFQARNALDQFASQAQQGAASLLGNLGGMRANIAQQGFDSLANQGLSVLFNTGGQNAFNSLASILSRPAEFRAGTLAQPNAIFRNAVTQGEVLSGAGGNSFIPGSGTAQQSIGQILAGIGGQFAQGGIERLFGF